MKQRAHMDGDVMITGLIPMYTLGIDHSNSHASRLEENKLLIFKNYQCVLGLAFAIEEINKNPDLLHNLTLGFDVYDVHFNAWTMFKNPFICLFGKYKIPNYSCVRGSSSIAVLTGPSGIASDQIGTLLGLYRFPQFTFGPFDHALSDHNKFPDLYQIAPKDTSIAAAMVSLLLHFSWSWVGLLTTEDDNGARILAELKVEMAKNRICVAYELVTSTQDAYKHIAVNHYINLSSASVLIIYGDNNSLIIFMIFIEQIITHGKVCIMNSQWDFTLKRRYFMLGSLHVPLIFTHHHVDVSGFTDFVKAVKPSKYPEDIFLLRLWFLSFNCSDSVSDCVTWDNCAHDASLDWLPGHSFDVSMSVDSYNIYNGVYAVAQALHEMLLHQTEVQTTGNRKGELPSSTQLLTFLKNNQFYNPIGNHVIWDKQRKLEPEYDILNIWNFPEGLELEVKVGKFSPYAPQANQLSLSEDMVQWSIETTETPHSVCSESCGPGFRKSPQEGKAACCFDCTPCSENEIANGTDMEQCVKCTDHQYANTHRTQCLLRVASFLAFGDPLGMVLACMALCFSMLTAVVLGVFVKHQDTAIVKANNRALSYILLISLIFCFLCSLLFLGQPKTATCILQQITFGVLFTVAVSTVLAKTVTVVLAFKATSPERRMRWLLVSGAPNFIIPICTLIQVTLGGLWLGTSPPFVDTDAHSEHGHIIILCNKGSLTAFYCALGYLGFLALCSFTVAFLARNLPDTFNEAKFLTFSMLVFCSVWLTFLPVYHSAKGKVMVAVEVFSILASGAGLLGCIFAPKCYTLLLMPNRNSLHGFRDKRHTLDRTTAQQLPRRKIMDKRRLNCELMVDLGEGKITVLTPHFVCSENCGSGFRKSPQKGKAAYCFDCTTCPENEIGNGTDYQYANTQRHSASGELQVSWLLEIPLGMALACMALSFFMLTAAVLGMFVKHQDTAIVKANNRALSYILLIALIFCFLCSLLFLGQPNTATCILQQITFGVIFTVAVSTVLAKTLTVVLAFKATSPERRMRWLLVSGVPNFIFPICTLIQVTLCGLWLGTSPPFVDTDANSEHGHVIILCNKGSLTAFYYVLGYLETLALASFSMAFLARNLPDTFNEAMFLTFSMLLF
ncbi:vomeronasal type-2 receptor 116-like [Dipodomys merriami]|uniref:vomeronasal type-2 receptor 116-like n=1 Tax=Dipodomys merriami TaxID=94247 RepID=UPI00385587BE